MGSGCCDFSECDDIPADAMRNPAALPAKMG